MDDMISRHAAIDTLESGKDKTAKGNIGGFYNAIIQNDIDKLRNLPSVQHERIRGRWHKISPAGIYECSACGQNVMTADIDVYHYCHGCGAYMREDQDEQDNEGNV